METGLETNHFVYENSGPKGLRINDAHLRIKVLHLMVMEMYIYKNCYYFFQVWCAWERSW